MFGVEAWSWNWIITLQKGILKIVYEKNEN